MYHKIVPVGAVAAGGGVIAMGMNSVGMVVAGATILIAGLTVIGLMPKISKLFK
jgi:hypothetical protein